MTSLPREVLDAVEDLYKNQNLDPREYPGIYIYWQGCGDSGGIDDLMFLTPKGLQWAKDLNECPPRWTSPKSQDQVEDFYACETVQQRYDPTPRTLPVQGNHRHDITIDEWVYKYFDVCEINDGGFAHVFIEMPFGKVWGNSYNWVQTEEEILTMEYED
jgi:hypothetical protein